MEVKNLIRGRPVLRIEAHGDTLEIQSLSVCVLFTKIKGYFEFSPFAILGEVCHNNCGEVSGVFCLQNEKTARNLTKRRREKKKKKTEKKEKRWNEVDEEKGGVERK